MAVTIQGVAAGSPAQRAGVRPGERLVSINGQPIGDVLDYRFYMTDRHVVLALEGEGGRRELSIHKGEYQELGLTFETYLMDRQRHCKNRCIFCFIDQNPPGMRESIYFKDDDDRLSFLFGNYITMTNLRDEDIERILKMHISPINISVHTADPDLRVRMMANPAAAQLRGRLERLCAGHIKINTQLVLCPGYNDGEDLERTLEYLCGLGESLQSVSCVPVGLTGHREGLCPLRPFTRQEAQQTIRTIHRFANRLQKERGDRVIFPSDEFFIRAGWQIPRAAYYGDFNQLENGVGLVALLRQEFFEALQQEEGAPLPRTVSIATGQAAAPFLRALADGAQARFPGLRCRVFPIENRFFGGYITVAGLVAGGDILAQLAGQPLGDCLLIPGCMLRHEGDLFLDDTPLPRLQEALGVPVRVVPQADGGALLDGLLGR